MVTRCDELRSEEEKEETWENAYIATNSSPSHTFLTWNYTEDNTERNPEIERIIFDILHYTLVTAERAVRQMKNQERNKREDEMMKALKGMSVGRQVAPDSLNGKMTFEVLIGASLPPSKAGLRRKPFFKHILCFSVPGVESANCGQRSVDFDSLLFQPIVSNFLMCLFIEKKKIFSKLLFDP